MSGNSGIIYQVDNGLFAIGYHREQNLEFQKFNKILVHLFHDSLCVKPVYNGSIGIKPPVLKDISKLKMIGFND